MSKVFSGVVGVILLLIALIALLLSYPLALVGNENNLVADNGSLILNLFVAFIFAINGAAILALRKSPDLLRAISNERLTEILSIVGLLLSCLLVYVVLLY